MAFWQRFFGGGKTPARVNAATQSAGGGVQITTSQELEEALRTGQVSASGSQVNASSAMRVGAVYACVRLISGAAATLPLHVKRRKDERTREDASDTKIWATLRRKPNRWQTPSQFRRMMQAHVLLRGNAYAMIVRSVTGDVLALIPLHPDRVETRQRDDQFLEYVYTRKDGGRVTLKQDEVFHLVGLTLDGVNGVSVITYARESIGLSLAMENHGATMFKNGARVSMVLKHPEKLGQEGRNNLKASLDEYRSGGESEGKVLILEEGMETTRLALTAEDAQWIESRKFSRTDIAMFFGVPPHMIGDTEKSTSWGTGIEQQSIGFVAYTLEDHLTMWEEAINRDLLPEGSDLYARFNRAALVKGDIKARWEAYVKGLQWGVYSPNEIRALEDQNPRADGDIYYPPPNTAGASPNESQSGGGNDPSQTS